MLNPKQMAKMISEDPDEVNPFDDTEDEFVDENRAPRADTASIWIRTTDEELANAYGWDDPTDHNEIGLWYKVDRAEFGPQDFDDIIKFIEAKGYRRGSGH
jgi:hypothetical protein